MSRCALGLMVPPTASEPHEAVGLRHGPLVGVRDARRLEGGDMYVRLETELMQWRGPLRDTDEVSWSFELADLLDWKRL